MSAYACNVEFEKYFLSGMLEGCRVKEKMGFVSWDDACDWAGKVTMSTECPYVVLEMKDLKTGEVEKF
jgi:hypothetical protein